MSRREIKLAKHYAHRGYHDKPQIPENSMAAFRRAVEYGLGSEFDVHLIADGSLVIFHDEQLERQTGVKGEIEDYDITNLRKLRLEGTDEMIPTFDEVLDLYEDTGLPLLIELKSARGNYTKLAEAVCKRLDSYKGEFVLESFDPRAVLAVKKFRPDFVRGQLVQDFFVTPEKLHMYQVVMLTYLMFNKLTKLELYEVSLVPVPANQTAVVTDIKNDDNIEEKAGKRNSAKDEALIRDAISALQALLDNADDQGEDESKANGAPEEQKASNPEKDALLNYIKSMEE